MSQGETTKIKGLVIIVIVLFIILFGLSLLINSLLGFNSALLFDVSAIAAFIGLIALAVCSEALGK